MAFIDNSGNTILDAVLTDLGRQYLAKADGTFNITEFGLGDDEINYALYNPLAATGAESTTIQQLPVFEALTKNEIALKHRLLNITRNNILYLPILKVNELDLSTKKTSGGYFAVCVNKDTEDRVLTSGSVDGVLGGGNPNDWKQYIRIDQGIDSTQISFTQKIPDDLKESSYQVKIDNRFGEVINLDDVPAPVTTIDDLQTATYEASLSGIDTALLSNALVQEINNTTDSKNMTIAGPRGTMLRFKIKASLNLQNSSFYFQQLGGIMSSSTFAVTGKTSDLYFIDTIVTVEGFVTGTKLDLPVRFLQMIVGS